jgi:ribonuclease Z
VADDTRPIDVYGPPGLDGYLGAALGFPPARLPFPLAVHEVTPGLLFDDGGVRVRCLPLAHRVPSFGYRLDEHDRPGHFDAARAAALGVPPGPLYGRLQRGERVRLEDGRTVDGAGLSGPPEPGRSLAYCTDTIYHQRSVELARRVDLLVHEATFATPDAELARVSGHSTAAEAARIAREAEVGRLVLTHFSSRYGGPGSPGAQLLLAEARAIFPDTTLAADFLQLEIPRHRPGSRRLPAQP